MPNVTLYQMPQVVTLTDTTGVSVSTVVNRTDFNLYKNVSNQIEFLFKTVDRKPISFAVAPTLFVVDERTETLVVQQTLTLVDSTSGHYRLTLSPTQVANLDNGYFRYAVTTQDSGGNQFLVYTDQYQSLRGYCQLFDGPIPPPQEPIQIDNSAFLATQWGDPLQTYYLAQSYPGAAASGNSSGLQTLAIYCDNWTGSFYVQASLENTPPQSDSQWFEVTMEMLVNQSTVASLQFTGNYMWLRFYYQPDVTNTGSISKVLLKN